MSLHTGVSQIVILLYSSFRNRMAHIIITTGNYVFHGVIYSPSSTTDFSIVCIGDLLSTVTEQMEFVCISKSPSSRLAITMLNVTWVYIEYLPAFAIFDIHKN